MPIRPLLTVILLAFALPSLAGEAPVPEALAKVLAHLIPNGKPDRVRKTPIEGLYEVTIGQQLVYMSADGRFLVQGDLVEVKTQRNLTEEERMGLRRAALNGLKEDDMIVYGPADAKHTVNVFTDIDCPYCVKFHQEVPELTKNGIKVRYLAFPRAGIGSPSYRKAVSVWCAKDKNKALTDAKLGKHVESKDCENPVATEYRLGQRLGVNGTPALVLDNGQLVPGYVPAQRLVGAFKQADR